MPGVMSSLDDHYHHTLIDMADENGFDWVMINYRGVSIPLEKGIPFHATDFIGFREPLRKILDDEYFLDERR